MGAVMDELFREAEPVLPIRGVHLDLKGDPPTEGRLLELLEVFAACRYNALLVEWEDSFPWTVDERFRSETVYSPEFVEQFHEQAERLGLDVVPLVQCLGHMETPLSVPGYEHLREVPHQAGSLNPLAPGAGDLVEKMVEDVLAAMPTPTYFHLGGDESWTFGTHPDTAAFIEESGKGELYLHHVEPILDMLNERGIRPILWHDMMREWDAESLQRLAGKADLCVWGYHGHPDTTDRHYSSRIIERFRDHGVPLWGGTAYKGASGHNVDLTDFDKHTANATSWAEVAQRYDMKGVFATGWSRYSTPAPQCTTIEAALDSLVNVAVILHDGRAPDGAADACRDALDPLGQRERFDAVRAAMKQLTTARRNGWLAVQHLREQITTATLDPRRRDGTPLMTRLRNLSQAVASAERAADDARDALAGAIEPIWTERYLAERIDPLCEELGLLAARVRALAPDAYDAELND